MSSSWSIEETNLLIRKRLELFGCSQQHKVYEYISAYLAQKHNYVRNAAACQTRFNNSLKTYRTCLKRMETGGQTTKMRFPYFDTFHQHYSKLVKAGDVETASNKCKSEIFLDDIYEDSSFADAGGDGGEGLLMDSMQTENCESPESARRFRSQQAQLGDEELTTSLTATNGVEDLKLRLMEQKLLYYTNQNMLLQMKQEHYRQKEHERARTKLLAEEILKVLKGIHTCLTKSVGSKATEKTPVVQREPEPELKVLKEVKILDEEPFPVDEEEVEEEEEAESGGPLAPTYGESDEEEVEEEEEYNASAAEIQPGGGGESSQEVGKTFEVGRLKVRKNIFPPWNRIQTVLLIKIHCDLRPKFRGYNLFECVSNKLIELHINRTPRDCRTRWNNLFRSYKDCRMRLKLNDKASVKFEYFDDIDAYFKDKDFSALC
ncbi:uncharacterized protein LOC131686008 [Topomyia yanbarensis]|uniref:uncharacterized protein LOC131686008 n=1 Tax=Topomyia yanbarensis TaxID=2498891 RepID=UPI00273C5823|nr:uncharacterized protein LOC131686008 [Topomyia yanbarensis]XP_058826099.1 uncharacterized protein LOC131686008 [Topomyia yanbarensis]